MNKLFNSCLENSLRVLLLLYSYKESYFNIDMISALDFIAINGKSLELNDNNLNGDNVFYLSEYTNKRIEIKEVIKKLLFKDLIEIKNTKQGFNYRINENGITLAESLNSNYAFEYIEAVKKMSTFTKNMSVKQLIFYINSQKAREN